MSELNQQQLCLGVAVAGTSQKKNVNKSQTVTYQNLLN